MRGSVAILCLAAAWRATANDDFKWTGDCEEKIRFPEKFPKDNNPMYYNGITINRTCWKNGTYDRYTIGNPVFLIGDWGGLNWGIGPVPADHTKTHDPFKRRNYNWNVDHNAQWRVAAAFNARAAMRQPDYVINVGDNFYWGGIDCHCGAMQFRCDTKQWKWIYEEMFKGPGVDGKMWLSVLGNHDWGGWQFNKGWDQVIAYSWGGLPEWTGRWLQPAIYWAAPMHYPDFDVDWLFVDSNIFDVRQSPWWDPEHNICGAQHSGTWAGAGCANSGPDSVFDCPGWFGTLWSNQQGWLDAKLKESITNQVDWQFIVTHFPPWWGEDQWKWLIWQYGVDLMVTGHVHRQDILEQYDWKNQFKPTVVCITGGGGGITAEFWPDNDGNDDQYGFIDMTLWGDKCLLQMISHGSKLRRSHSFTQRQAVWKPEKYNVKYLHTTTQAPSTTATPEAMKRNASVSKNISDSKDEEVDFRKLSAKAGINI
mmetsp:Transcript_68091/g.160266  ORF Transcript_68091/g.160266 Transcript_68091/m.160266 type:complete len:480 (+) Transcript_68091:68-1507(+)